MKTGVARHRARLAPIARGSTGPADSTWPSYGNDPGGGRYSTLAQINRSNVAQLQVAWTHRTGALQPETPLNKKAAFEATPILVEGKLFLSTPFNQVIALDPGTGAKLWEHDVKLDRARTTSEVTSRGVSAWRDTMSAPGAACRLRIFMGTLDARLVALDGETGTPCGGFGVNGQVDLTRGVDLRDLGQYQVTSAPAIAGDLVIVGSSIGDNRAVDVERGIVRAFDARSGALRWSWDPIPGPATPRRAPAPATRGRRCRSIAERGLVFVPTGSPSPDHYGGVRKGDNRWANSVVALQGGHRRARLGISGRAPRPLGLRRRLAADPLAWKDRHTRRSRSRRRWAVCSCSIGSPGRR